MADEPDLFRSAKLLVERFGHDEALATARRREKEMLDQGEIIGAAAWRGIYTAIEELGNIEPKDNTIH